MTMKLFTPSPQVLYKMYFLITASFLEACLFFKDLILNSIPFVTF